MGTITPKKSMDTASFGKTSQFIEQEYQQQTSTLLCWVLESIFDLRSVFLGHINFKKLMKFREFIGIFHCCMTRLRNTSLGVFIQFQYTITILRNTNMRHSLFYETLKISKLRWNNLLWHYQTQEHEFGCFYTISVHKNNFKKEKFGAESD